MFLCCVCSLDVVLKNLPEKVVAKVSAKADNNEIALLDATVLRKEPTGNEPQISIKSTVANQWVITLTRVKGAGGLSSKTSLDADILVTGRKVTLEVSRRQEGDVRTLDGDLKWDASRDASKSVQVHSVTSVRRGSIIIDSK